MITNLKHSELFKWTLRIWMILFFGFLYIQYYNLHTHYFNGRFITHSHLTGKNYFSDDEDQLPVAPIDQKAHHDHSKNDFFYYSFVTGILAVILIATAFVLTLNRKKQMIKQILLFSVRYLAYINTTLRAPPALQTI